MQKRSKPPWLFYAWFFTMVILVAYGISIEFYKDFVCDCCTK
jgi:hypothetical protein